MDGWGRLAGALASSAVFGFTAKIANCPSFLTRTSRSSAVCRAVPGGTERATCPHRRQVGRRVRVRTRRRQGLCVRLDREMRGEKQSARDAGSVHFASSMPPAHYDLESAPHSTQIEFMRRRGSCRCGRLRKREQHKSCGRRSDFAQRKSACHTHA